MVGDSVLVEVVLIVYSEVVLALSSSTSAVTAGGCLARTAAVMCRGWTSDAY